MIKKTLIALAAVALLVSVTQAAITVVPFSAASGDWEFSGVKVDGSQTVRWPFDYKALVICQIPIKMAVGMFVQVKDCDDKKIILQQEKCNRLSELTGGKVGNKDDNEFPCYKGCTKFEVRANFEVKLGTNRVKKSGVDIIDSDRWSSYYSDPAGSVIPGDGQWHEVEACVVAWRVRLWNALDSSGLIGDETEVGTLEITAKPNV